MVKEFEDLTNGSLTEGAQVPDSEPKTENKMIAKIVIASKDKVTFQQDWVKNCYQTQADTTYDKKDIQMFRKMPVMHRKPMER